MTGFADDSQESETQRCGFLFTAFESVTQIFV